MASTSTKFLVGIALSVLITALTPKTTAKNVDSLLARNTAEAFFASKGVRSGLYDITPAEWKGTLFLYATGQKGYVLLPADDAVRPILAYSTEATFPTENIPPHVQALIQSYSDILEYARQQHLPQHPSWEKVMSGTEFRSKSRAGVGPLVTTTWGQNYPYNTLCPLDSAWTIPIPCVTGCTATAMAQIMHYWRWPDIGWGQHEYLWTNINLQPLGTLSEQFDTVHYQWDLMPDALDTLSSEAEIYAVARLIYDCGVAVNMRYSGSKSAAPIWNETFPSSPSAGQALRTFFRYHPTLHHVSRSNYTDSEWLDLMLSELDAGHPVLYAGWPISGDGHAFVADGYDEDRRLHFNFGWKGKCDGFYAIDSLYLSSNTEYTCKHTALIGIRPNFEECDPAVIQAVAESPIAGYCTGGGEYAYGDSVSLVAHTHEGYRFDGWTSGINDINENPHYLPATICLSDTARIRRIDSDTLYHYTPMDNPSWDDSKAPVRDITRWGIRIPASCLHGRRIISSVQLYKTYPVYDDNIRLNIYSGNFPEDGTPLYEHIYHIPYEFEGWFTLAIDDSIVIDSNSDLWIILTTYSSMFNWPLHGRSTYSGNSDGCWFYMPDGWHTLDSVGIWATWKIRTILSPYTDTVVVGDVPSVYPNPTSGKATISCTDTLISAYLTDMLGRSEDVRLVPQDQCFYSIDLSTYPNTTYLLTLVTVDGKRHTVKLVKREI